MTSLIKKKKKTKQSFNKLIMLGTKTARLEIPCPLKT